jgi:hypothetical protein
MLTPANVIVAVWIVVAALTRSTLVPAAMSDATFGWGNILAGSVLAVVVLTAANARPVRSIAHVLYETEHPRERR